MEGASLMLVEAAVGTAFGWLWERLGNVAESKDKEKAIKKALQESIDQSFREFHEKYGNKSESFFNQEFVENHACPEILKYLSRNQYPDIDAISQALPVISIFSSASGFKEELKDFFEMVMNRMKSHAVLQDIISYRQTEETNQIVKDIHEGQKGHSKVLDDCFKKIDFQQEESSRDIKNIISQNAEIIQHLDKLHNLKNDDLPSSKGDEINKLLAKQLDKAKDLIKNGKIIDAKSILDLIEEEVATSDNYTRFRWHTNQGACLLFQDQRQDAAEQYLIAYNFAKNEEKAVANKIRALLLLGEFDSALKETDQAITDYSQSGIIWALHINAKDLLNIKFDFSTLTENLQKDKSVLLIFSDIKRRENDYEVSYNLAREAFQQDESSIDAKRAMLTSALAWATADTVKSYYKQLGVNQRKSLIESVGSFGDILSLLKTIQSKHVFVEVAHSLAIATELIGEEKLNDEIIKYALSMYPDEEAMIWYRVWELKAVCDIDSIHSLTDDKLTAFGKPLLFALAEIGSNTGDKKWVDSIAQILNSKELSDRESADLFGMKLCAIWKGGKKSAAIDLARDNLPRIKSYPSLLVFYIRILDEYGEFSERDKLLQQCKDLPETATSMDIIQIADLLYDFDLYFDASELYQKLIESPSEDYLSKRYLESLIKSDQRSKAATVIDQLPSEIRTTSSFKRIEANLARATGDIDKLERILSEELTTNPSDSYVATGYIATLYRNNKFSELNEYLSDNPIFDPVIEQNEIEIAKYQIELGYQYQALLRVYRLFRAKPGDSELAGHFLLLMMLAKDFDKFKGLDEVRSGVVINMESNGENKSVVIEPESLQGAGWPQCVFDNSELAKDILGKKVGDEIHVNTGMGSKQWKIVNIDSMFIFASSIAHNVVANSASSGGPLWSVNVKKSGGEFDFSQILESLKRRSQHVDHVFSVYEDKKLPLQMLSDALGTDIVTLLLEWPYKKYDLFVCNGTHEEREDIKRQISLGARPYVIDLTALIELHSLGLLKKSLAVFGKPLVASSLKEYLLGIIQIHNKMVPSGVVSEIDGYLNYQEIPQSYLDDRGKFLNELREFIDQYCDVVPVVGPEVMSKQQADLEQFIGIASNDTILLTRERDAILISEDGGFRSLAFGMGATSSSWLQPILMILRDKKVISDCQYSKIVLRKLERHHTFTSICENDLLWAAKSTPGIVSPTVESAIHTFKSPTLDLASGVVVGARFLNSAVEYVSPSALYDYYKLIIESLSYDRNQYLDEIHEVLRSKIESALTNLNRSKSKAIYRKFGGVLDRPPEKQFSLRYTPIARAVKIALREWN